MERVTKKQSSEARKFAKVVLNYLHNELSDKYTFAERLVGSAQWNTILKDSKGFWDIDYQLLLTSNSEEYLKNGLKNATKIKNDFFNCLNKFFKNNKNFRVENSTTAVTIINLTDKYSYDFVIIRLFPQNREIIRRNNKRNSSINEFTWNQLPKFNDAYKKLDKLSPFEKQDLIENYVLPRKVIEKRKNDNDPSKKSSCEVFIEEVNNYVRRKNY